ncbi:MAG: hypothetical protein AAB425_04885 [Bdellovibrionota bacterium]
MRLDFVRTAILTAFVLSQSVALAAASKKTEMVEFGAYSESEFAMSWEESSDGAPQRAYLVRLTPREVEENGQTVDVEVLEPRGEPARDGQTRDGHTMEDIDVVATWSIRVSTPQALSASLGIIIGPSECDEIQICSPRGLLIQVEPGIAGGKLSIGYASVGGLALWKSWLLSAPLTGFDVKASLLNVWNAHSIGGDPGNLYAGVEGDFGFFMLKFSLGVFYRVFGPEATSDWIVSAGAGLGF